jgi:excisionase family DNA binding protein
MRKSGDLIRAIDLESISSAAKRLGVHRTRIYQMVGEGKLDAYEFGSRKLVHKRDIDRIIEQRNRKAG